jgi:hypothetical protein
MTAKCPGCSAAVDVVVTHQGHGSDGVMQRAVIEAFHTGTPCPHWTGDSAADLVLLAAAAES